MHLVIKEITLIIPAVHVDNELHTINLETEVIKLTVDDFCKEMGIDKDECMEKIIELMYGINREVKEVGI